MRKENGILKTLLPYTGTRLRCQDAWPSCCCRKATAYTSFAFGSTDTWRQLTEMIYGFQGYGSIFWDSSCVMRINGHYIYTIRRIVATMSAHCIFEGGSIHKYSPFLMHLVNSWYKEMREATTSATVSTMVEGIELPALAVTSSGQIVPSWTSEPK